MIVTEMKPSEVEFSVPRLADRQPVHKGYPFVIHVPFSLYEAKKQQLGVYMDASNVVLQVKTPAFLRTDLLYLRIQFRYGDAKRATNVYEFLTRESSAFIFKNWL